MTLSKLNERVAIVATVDPIAAATSGGTASTTSKTTDVVDMSDFSRVMMVLSAGVIAANSQVAFTVYSGTATATVTTLVKAATTLTATDDNKQVIVEVDERDLALDHRYIKGVVVVSPSAGTSASALVNVVALGGDPRFGPAYDNDLASVAEIANS